jgi:peptidoglycan-associated lipoprotein
MKLTKGLFIFLLIGLIFSGCAQPPKKAPLQPAPLARTPPPIFGEMSTREAAFPDMPTDAAMPLSDSDMQGGGQDAPAERIIYFDYDKSEIKSRARQILEQHATYLTQNPQVSVRLEGHADERGSREYNLALGERRAQSAQQILNGLGVFDNQISTISYGEERPVAPGHYPKAWGLNRRVEIVYF